MTIAEGKRTVQPLGKSAQSIFAAGDYGEILLTELLPRNYGAAYNGIQFSLSMNAPVTASSTTNTALAAGTATPPLALWNPPGSGKNIVITKVGAINISGTPAGPLVWNYGAYSAGTTATATTPVTGLLGGSPGTQTKAYMTTTASTATTTGSVAGTFYKIACGFSAVAALGSAVGTPFYEETGGDIICPPGQWIALATFGTGTTHLFMAGLSWIEVPV
jgi:hypothetical protein